jgi:hypothetical protein
VRRTNAHGTDYVCLCLSAPSARLPIDGYGRNSVRTICQWRLGSFQFTTTGYNNMAKEQTCYGHLQQRHIQHGHTRMWNNMAAVWSKRWQPGFDHMTARLWGEYAVSRHRVLLLQTCSTTADIKGMRYLESDTKVALTKRHHLRTLFFGTHRLRNIQHTAYSRLWAYTAFTHQSDYKIHSLWIYAVVKISFRQTHKPSEKKENDV